MRKCKTRDEAIKVFTGRSRKSDEDFINIRFKNSILKEFSNNK